MKTIDEQNAYAKLSAWCSISEHCESEAIDKLMKWGFNPDEQERIIQELKANDFLNENRYTKAFVHDKFKIDRWGRKKISEALYLKKIPTSIILETIHAIDENEYEEALISLLKSKRRSIHGADEKECLQKLYKFAISRGFEYQIISKHLKIEEEIPEQND